MKAFVLFISLLILIPNTTFALATFASDGGTQEASSFTEYLQFGERLFGISINENNLVKVCTIAKPVVTCITGYDFNLVVEEAIRSFADENELNAPE